MKLDDWSLLKNETLTDEEVGKLNLVLAFHARLPTEEMRQQLLVLMEEGRCMAPGEFDLRLDQFAAQAKAAMAPFHTGEHAAYALSAKVH
jgi:hypothetical protein